MKLLHDFFRLHLAGQPAALGRDVSPLPGFSVTVPAPLAAAAVDHVTPLEPAVARRREPASFLKAARHRRRGAAR